MADSQRKTANLFDKSSDVVGYYISSVSGVWTQTGSTSRSVLIKCEPNTTYTIYVPTNRTLRAVYFYNFPSAGDTGYGYTDNTTGNYVNKTLTITTSSSAHYLAFFCYNSAQEATMYDEAEYFSQIMLNAGSTALPYEPYWQHSLRKLTTATEAVENPLYSDGTAITAYTIKGNTVQNGTPTPSNPVEVNGVGVRTGNLFDGQWQQGYYAYSTGDYNFGDNYVCTHLIPCTENTTYTFKCISMAGGSKNYGYVFFDSTQSRIGSDYINEITEGDVVTHTATTPQNTAFLAINIAYGRRQVPVVRPSDITNFMLNTGSTALPYEPYGYKIPISNGEQTTNIYLGSTPLDKNGTAVDTIEDNTLYKATNRAVLTGSENWTLQSINSYGIANFYLANVLTGLDVTKGIICSHGERQTTGISQTTTEGFIANNNGEIYFRINSTTASTVPEFQAWLSEQNPQVTFLYTLATPTSTTVTAPSIPTTEGANSITVDTTVQPSEFTATWTGWHDASVKEKSENLFDGVIEQGSITNEGNLDSELRVRSKNYISVSELQYTISATGNANKVLVYCYDENKNVLNNTSWENIPYSSPSDSEAKYIRIIFKNVVGGVDQNISPADVSNVMVDTGSTALPYEPYWK